jgi:hypothetical protein
MAASVIGIFFLPAIFYMVEKWAGAEKKPAGVALPAMPAPVEGD